MTDTRIDELQAVVNALPLLFFQKDTRNRILRTNQVVADMLGTTVNSLIGTAADHWFPDESEENFNDDLQVMNSGQARLGMIEQLRLPYAGKQWVSTDKYPHYDSSGTVDGILVFSRCVDGKTLAGVPGSELEAQLRYAHKLDSIGVLAAGIAHDFNNYLTIVIAGTEMALQKIGRGNPDALPLEESLKAAHEAARVASQLVTYAGRSVVLSKPVNLSELIESFRDMLQASVANTVELELDLDFDIPLVDADVAQIHQLLVNIVINASEAIGAAQGKIRIQTGERHCRVKDLMNTLIGSALSPGRYVVVSIGDSGCGMSADVLDSVFEPFFSTKKSGRGLGLATVIGIVKGHRGTLSVSSSEQHGTTIDLLFPALAGNDAGCPLTGDKTAPCVEAGESVSSPGPVEPAAPSDAPCILIVDDNKSVSEILQHFVESAGYQSICVADGNEALSLVASETPIDLAIVDYCMPGKNGLELFKLVRESRPALPFLLVSGSANLVSINEFKRMPNVAFLQKPFNRAAIMEKLHSLLEGLRVGQQG